MSILLYLIPIALTLGLAGLVAFMWALRSGQFDDLDGAANRILFDDDEPRPTIPKPPRPAAGNSTNPTQKGE
jgi:cbb3-type cytochrome oxidase maturation protein